MDMHLNDEQWAAVVLSENDDAAAKHLAGCAACREELRSFLGAAGAAQAQIRNAVEQPQAFWQRQRENISARLPARDFIHPWNRWVWVTASVTLILLASALVFRNGAQPTHTAAQPDPDDAFLLSVQRSIRSDLPKALRPAALLTREIDRAEAAHRNP